MRDSIWKIWLIVLIVLPAGLFGQSINPDVMHMMANLEKGEYSSILESDNIPLNLYDQAMFYYARGIALDETGDLEAAIEQYKKADDLETGLASFELAKAFKILGNTTEQYLYLGRLLESGYKLDRKDIMLDPVFSDLDRNRDWIRFWAKKWYSEKEDLRAECEYRLSKNDTDPEFWLGALQQYQDDAIIIALQAQYHYQTDENKKAEQNFRRALDIAPNNELVLSKYADFLYATGKKDEAVQVYNNLIFSKPYEIQYYLQRAKTLIGLGKSGRGVEEVERLKEIGIDASDLNLLIAKELIDKDPDKAISFLDPIIRNSPVKLAFNLRAQSKIAIGSIDEAISDYAMSLDIDPRQPDVYFSRAKLRLQQGDKVGACYDWSHALQLGHRKAADMLHKHCR